MGFVQYNLLDKALPHADLRTKRTKEILPPKIHVAPCQQGRMAVGRGPEAELATCCDSGLETNRRTY
jgi:hypothetical protein